MSWTVVNQRVQGGNGVEGGKGYHDRRGKERLEEGVL